MHRSTMMDDVILLVRKMGVCEARAHSMNSGRTGRSRAKMTHGISPQSKSFWIIDLRCSDEKECMYSCSVSPMSMMRAASK